MKTHPKRPNILVLMADQLRQDALGCYGNPLIRTPNLDRLAGEGLRFTNANCPTPICVASRMSFITGHRLSRHHWCDNNSLPGPIPELPTIMTLLHRAGYHTQGVGKMHFRGRMYGFQSLLRMEEVNHVRIDDDYLLYLKENGIRTRFPQGLRDLLYYQPQTCGIPEEHSMSRWVANQSVQFLRDHVKYRKDKPFFLWSSWTAPHPPFAPCEPYDTMYDPEDLPLPEYVERPLSTLPEVCHGHRARLDGAHLDADRIRRIRALYAGQVSQVDDCVGQLLDELRNLGLDDNTIVFFVSDHGDMLGDHGLSQKNVPYRASISIPMLLKWPGKAQPGKTCESLAGIEDFLPTLVEELDLEYDTGAAPLPGLNLLKMADADPDCTRSHYTIDYGNGKNRWISVLTRRYKYVYWACGGHRELYDLINDPNETQNRADDLPDVVEQLHQHLVAWEQKWGLPTSFESNSLKAWPTGPSKPASQTPRGVNINDGTWADNLPDDEKGSVESYAEAFTRAISKETTLSPEKVSIGSYKTKGGNSLVGTPWEDAWNACETKEEA